MAKRLTKICTRTGDDGTTGLGDGSRVSKGSARIAVLGEIDELNCAVGLILTEPIDATLAQHLTEIQHDLFDLGGELCIPGSSLLDEARVAALEECITAFNRELPALKEFILPGGSRAAAFAHMARVICRRAERAVVMLAEAEPVEQAPRLYLNRLSDFLFVLARVLNRNAGRSDVLWQHRPKK